MNLDTSAKIDLYKKNLIELFLTRNNIKKFIFGINNTSFELLKIAKINGFIDDYTKENEINKIPIITTNQVPKNSIVISCSISIYPYTSYKKLKDESIEHILTIFDILKYTKNLNLNYFLYNANKDILENTHKYRYIYNRLIDKESKKILLSLLNFRKNLDLIYLKDFKVNVENQYFEDFLNFNDNEVFIDVGGFDGLTSLEFIKYSPNFKSIFIFEPSEENLILAKKNLKNHKSINFIKKGLSSKKDILKFNTNNGSASSISEKGNIQIEVDSLDNLVQEKVTFIKIDIEGAESSAIEGMRKHILNDYPKMAISVYHKFNDFWKIPEQIFEIRNDYNIYLRHYTEGTDETIMFFIPQSNS